MKLELKKAYLVRDWADKIEEGEATEITYIDMWEQKKVIFLKKGEEIPIMAKPNEVVYSKQKALLRLEEEKECRRSKWKGRKGFTWKPLKPEFPSF